MRPPFCPAIVFDLIVNPESLTRVTDTVCQGQSYLGYGATGVYSDTFPAANGCDSIRTLYLTVLGPPAPDLGAVTSLCTGDTLLLSPGVFSTYLWQDGSTSGQYVVKQAGAFSVTVTNKCGTASASVTIAAKTCFIDFPNAFTPGRLGDNDVFRVLTQFQLQDYDLTVFNRAGQRLFGTHDQTRGWDGTYKGKAQAAGTYVWNCSFSREGRQMRMKGTVLLIR